MKSIRLSLLFLLLTAALLLVAGCSRHYVDVYINDDCFLVTMENDKIIDPLLVFPGDYVVFTNITGHKVELNLPDGMFSEDDVEIAAGKRVILEVIQKDPGERSMVIVCTGGTGSPRVVVGEDP